MRLYDRVKKQTNSEIHLVHKHKFCDFHCDLDQWCGSTGSYGCALGLTMKGPLYLDLIVLL